MAFITKITIMLYMIPYIIGGIILLVILIFLGLFIGSRMKGKLELTLTKGGYVPGEAVEGDILLTAKKDLEGIRFFVALVGYEEIKRRYEDSNGNSKTKTDKNEVYRDELDLEGAGPVIAGTSQSYPFQMNAPIAEGADQQNAEGGNSALLKAVGVLASAFGNNMNRRMVWEVQARYDLKGIDLKAKKRVTISGL